MTAPFMAENEGYKLLDQLADAGVEKVNFVGGEPMLHPHIEAWIIYAKK
jgi:MoaA/NifB/PqqE/SkfB family radical SAM enzyme